MNRKKNIKYGLSYKICAQFDCVNPVAYNSLTHFMPLLSKRWYSSHTTVSATIPHDRDKECCYV